MHQLRIKGSLLCALPVATYPIHSHCNVGVGTFDGCSQFVSMF